MDIVLTTRPSVFQDTHLRFALRSLEHLDHNNLVVIGEMEKPPRGCDVIASGGSEMDKMYVAAHNEMVSDDFIWMPDSCVLTGKFSPMRYVKTGGSLYRRADEVDTMVNTIRFLLDNQMDTLDYELEIPLLMNRTKLRALFETIGGASTPYCIRSLYFNMFPEPALRIPTTFIEKWSHYDDPKSVVVSLSDKCLEHEQCLKWLRRKLPTKSQHEFTPAVP